MIVLTRSTAKKLTNMPCMLVSFLKLPLSDPLTHKSPANCLFLTTDSPTFHKKPCPSCQELLPAVKPLFLKPAGNPLLLPALAPMPYDPQSEPPSSLLNSPNARYAPHARGVQLTPVDHIVGGWGQRRGAGPRRSEERRCCGLNVFSLVRTLRGRRNRARASDAAHALPACSGERGGNEIQENGAFGDFR